MKLKNKAFTLVELLVVITILAIISVVAYQNFGWAVDKAVSGRKISDVSTIETALQQYKADKNYYPPTDEYSATNLWGYNPVQIAQPSNTIRVVYDGLEIVSLTWSVNMWWWKVYWTWTLWSTQIWSKWTISQKTLGKRYLTKDLYDPELWDIKVDTEKMIDFWIWRYVYAIYKKGSDNTRWNDYNIAFTIKKQESDLYLTKIVWSYDNESCYLSSANENDCPTTLLWTASWSALNVTLNDWDEQNFGVDTISPNQWIPYPVTDFAD